jgi:hypothetical protein
MFAWNSEQILTHLSTPAVGSLLSLIHNHKELKLVSTIISSFTSCCGHFEVETENSQVFHYFFYLGMLNMFDGSPESYLKWVCLSVCDTLIGKQMDRWDSPDFQFHIMISLIMHLKSFYGLIYFSPKLKTINSQKYEGCRLNCCPEHLGMASIFISYDSWLLSFFFKFQKCATTCISRFLLVSSVFWAYLLPMYVHPWHMTKSLESDGHGQFHTRWRLSSITLWLPITGLCFALITNRRCGWI